MCCIETVCKDCTNCQTDHYKKTSLLMFSNVLYKTKQNHTRLCVKLGFSSHLIPLPFRKASICPFPVKENKNQFCLQVNFLVKDDGDVLMGCRTCYLMHLRKASEPCCNCYSQGLEQTEESCRVYL